MLRQHSFDDRSNDDRSLIPAVIKLASEAFGEGNFERAEEHYRLGLALYEACFHQEHAEALSCVSGLILICKQSLRQKWEMLHLIEQAQEITERLQAAFSKPRVVQERRVC